MSAAALAVGAPAEAGLPPSAFCTAPRDAMVELRIRSRHIRYRVHPDARRIVEIGVRRQVIRASPPIHLLAKALCDPTVARNAPPGAWSGGDIMIFMAGEQGHQLIEPEYPGWEDAPPPVRVRINGRTLLVPPGAVRMLLDQVSFADPPTG